MTESEKRKTLIAFEKIVDGEPVSYFDAERFFNFITSVDIQISSPSPDELAQLRNRANLAWQKKYMQKSQ